MRAFIGFKVDDCLEKIEYVIRELKLKDSNARYIRLENVHITLNFLGEITNDQVMQVIDILKEINENAVEVCLDKVCNFHNMAIIQVNKNIELLKLQKNLTKALISNNFKIEKRKYFPHITLARKFNAYVLKNIKLITKVEEIILFSSEYIEGKLTYTPIFAQKLGG